MQTLPLSCGARICDGARGVGVLVIIGLLCGDSVLAGRAAEDLFAADPVVGQVDLRRWGACLKGRELTKGLVRPGDVVLA
jgi:hypothetical protein